MFFLHQLYSVWLSIPMLDGLLESGHILSPWLTVAGEKRTLYPVRPSALGNLREESAWAFVSLLEATQGISGRNCQRHLTRGLSRRPRKTKPHRKQAQSLKNQSRGPQKEDSVGRKEETEVSQSKGLWDKRSSMQQVENVSNLPLLHLDKNKAKEIYPTKRSSGKRNIFKCKTEK